ncbi:MAG: TrmH family RNA methyltransferase [Bacteroidales bacterium]|nr:TrmH family RNA methyltransferase [Bacteroidales bacterium]
MSDIIPSVEFFNQESFKMKDEISPYVIGVGLHTPENIGAIIRLAANLGAKKAFFIPGKGEYRNAKIERSASSAGKSMNWEIANLEKIKEEIPADYSWVAIETAAEATNLFTTKLPEKCVFIAGNERFGMNDEFLTNCDQKVFIPMPGITKSMNVSHAMSVTLFEWYRQQYFQLIND